MQASRWVSYSLISGQLCDLQFSFDCDVIFTPFSAYGFLEYEDRRDAEVRTVCLSCVFVRFVLSHG